MGANEPDLSDLLRHQHHLLDQMLGPGGWRVEAIRPAACLLKSADLEIEFSYDPRDQWVSSMIKPLNVPPDLAESFPAGTYLRWCEIDEPIRRKSDPNGDQLIAELNLIEPVIRTLRKPERSREAMWFVRGYCAAYTDWASGRFG